jgi:hypothetical protein
MYNKIKKDKSYPTMIEPITTKYLKGTRKYFKGTKYYPTSEFLAIRLIDILILSSSQPSAIIGLLLFS